MPCARWRANLSPLAAAIWRMPCSQSLIAQVLSASIAHYHRTLTQTQPRAAESFRSPTLPYRAPCWPQLTGLPVHTVQPSWRHLPRSRPQSRESALRSPRIDRSGLRRDAWANWLHDQGAAGRCSSAGHALVSRRQDRSPRPHNV